MSVCPRFGPRFLLPQLLFKNTTFYTKGCHSKNVNGQILISAKEYDFVFKYALFDLYTTNIFLIKYEHEIFEQPPMG